MWDELSTLPQYQISLVLPCNRVTNWTAEEFATNGANGAAQVSVRGGRRRRLLSSATAPVLTVRPNLYVAMACTFVTVSSYEALSGACSSNAAAQPPPPPPPSSSGKETGFLEETGVQGLPDYIDIRFP